MRHAEFSHLLGLLGDEEGERRLQTALSSLTSRVHLKPDCSQAGLREDPLAGWRQKGIGCKRRKDLTVSKMTICDFISQ